MGADVGDQEQQREQGPAEGGDDADNRQLAAALVRAHEALQSQQRAWRACRFEQPCRAGGGLGKRGAPADAESRVGRAGVAARRAAGGARNHSRYLEPNSEQLSCRHREAGCSSLSRRELGQQQFGVLDEIGTLGEEDARRAI